MPKHASTAVVIAIRCPTEVEVVDGRDKDRDNRVMVAHPAMVLRDEADLVHMVAIIMASRVTAGRSILSVPIRDHLYHLGALINRVGLHHFGVCRDGPSLASLVSPPLICSSSSNNTSIVLKHLVTKVIPQDIRHHPGVRAPIRLQVQGLVPIYLDRAGVRISLLPELMQFR